ncbi:MAG TPA: hypothetical protein VK009_10365 [Chloroflexota bacterium]|nr:hypothetical protein [Chloroflexota bacterium]
MDNDHRFPCLDGHTYSGCLGQACSADRCWNGRRVQFAGVRGTITVDAFDRPLKVLRYTACDCANCLHAVDLEVPRELRSPGGRLIKRWTICEMGLWAGPASLYNLLNHRVPLRHVGACASFVARPALRPELQRQREADQERSRQRRARLREAKRNHEAA